MKKKASWWQNVLLAAFIAALAFGAWQTEKIGKHMQYLIQPPAQAVQTESPAVDEDPDAAAPVFKPNQPIADAVKRLHDMADEWDTTTMETWTVGGVKESVDITSERGLTNEKKARLELMGERGLLLHPLLAREGRLFFPEELAKGDKVALLDEKLALEIFKIPDPIGQNVFISGVKYRVIGVVRHAKQVGDYADYGAYVPLMSVVGESLQLDALTVEADPKPGLGANVSFEKIVGLWGNWNTSGGSFYDLGKESMGARLWLRVLLFVAGMTLCLRLIRWLNGRVGYYSKRYRLQLQRKYAIALLPELSGAILLFILGYGLAIGLLGALMAYILQPVYTFPEWIPTILVEWEDIARAFWNVWQLPAVMIELRSPEIIRLQWLDLLIKGCSAGAAVLLALRYARSRTLADEMNDSLTGLYLEGVLVSILRTTRPIAMAEMGYVPCEETDAWQNGPLHPRRRRRRWQSTPMMRIINAEQILTQLPPGKRDGTFVIEVTDDRIEDNNRRWQISCIDGEKTIKEVSRDWDLQVPIDTLTRIVYGRQKFADFLENNAGYDLKMHSPAMDGLFDQQLPITPGAL